MSFGDAPIQHITHLMPLPEIPKGGVVVRPPSIAPA